MSSTGRSVYPPHVAGGHVAGVGHYAVRPESNASRAPPVAPRPFAVVGGCGASMLFAYPHPAPPTTPATPPPVDEFDDLRSVGVDSSISVPRVRTTQPRCPPRPRVTSAVRSGGVQVQGSPPPPYAAGALRPAQSGAPVPDEPHVVEPSFRHHAAPPSSATQSIPRSAVGQLVTPSLVRSSMPPNASRTPQMRDRGMVSLVGSYGSPGVEIVVPRRGSVSMTFSDNGSDRGSASSLRSLSVTSDVRSAASSRVARADTGDERGQRRGKGAKGKRDTFFQWAAGR